MPRGRRPRELSQDEALARLAALSKPKPNPTRTADHLKDLRAKKAALHALDVKEEAERVKRQAVANMALVAQAGGLHVASSSSSTGKVPGDKLVHGKSWDAMQVLRACYTPVSPGAYSAVLECGSHGPRDCKNVVAECIMAKFREGKRFFSIGCAQTIFKNKINK